MSVRPYDEVFKESTRNRLQFTLKKLNKKNAAPGKSDPRKAACCPNLECLLSPTTPMDQAGSNVSYAHPFFSAHLLNWQHLQALI